MPFTPGPWVTRGIDVYAFNGTNRYICTCSGNAYANAQLIASAPDLLEALKELLAEIDEDTVGAGTSVIIGKARDAVSRARGGEDEIEREVRG